MQRTELTKELLEHLQSANYLKISKTGKKFKIGDRWVLVGKGINKIIKANCECSICKGKASIVEIHKKQRNINNHIVHDVAFLVNDAKLYIASSNGLIICGHCAEKNNENVSDET
jgi:hypothetical protein